MSFIKTITMSFNEYEKLVQEAKKSREELKVYQEAVIVVYGPEAELVFDKATEIRETRRKHEIHHLVRTGKL